MQIKIKVTVNHKLKLESTFYKIYMLIFLKNTICHSARPAWKIKMKT